MFYITKYISKKYSLAGVVVALSFSLTMRLAPASLHEAALPCVCIAFTCLLAASYIKHQAEIDAREK